MLGGSAARSERHGISKIADKTAKELRFGKTARFAGMILTLRSRVIELRKGIVSSLCKIGIRCGTHVTVQRTGS